MLNKSDMRPAYAAVGQNSSANNRADMNYAVFSAAQVEDDDFNTFGDTSARSNASAPKQRQSHQNQQSTRKPPKKKNFSVSPKMIIISVAAVVALVLIIALFAAIFSSPGKNIIREDDVYTTYIDSNDVYHVLYNGKEIKHTFEGKVELQPAKDYSFAYVFEEVVSDEGTSSIQMYILDGKKIDPIEGTADTIIACAEYEPGIIFKKGSLVSFHSKTADEEITGHSSAANFKISGDASTIVFTEPAGRNQETTHLKYFRNAGYNDIGETSGLIPVAIAKDGKYVYATDSTGSFYYLRVTKRGAEYEQKTIVSNSSYTFGEVTELNADGTEVIFTYIDGAEENAATASFIYKIGDKAPSQIAAGALKYTPMDKEVVCPSTFIDSAFTVDRTVTTADDETVNVTSTFYYTRKGARKLADAEGQFSPDGKYFYFLDSNQLFRIPLSSNDFEADKEMISGSAVDAFELTEKGDIYTYRNPTANELGSITWRKADKTVTKKVVEGLDANSVYICGNTVYFSQTVNGDLTIYKAVDDSTKEAVTFKKTIADTHMTIIMGSGDKGYAYFTDIDGNTKLLYTSNGKTFDIICDSCTIPRHSSDISTPTPGTSNKPTNNTPNATDSSDDEDSAG